MVKNMPLKIHQSDYFQNGSDKESDRESVASDVATLTRSKNKLMAVENAEQKQRVDSVLDPTFLWGLGSALLVLTAVYFYFLSIQCEVNANEELRVTLQFAREKMKQADFLDFLAAQDHPNPT